MFSHNPTPLRVTMVGFRLLSVAHSSPPPPTFPPSPSSILADGDSGGDSRETPRARRHPVRLYNWVSRRTLRAVGCCGRCTVPRLPLPFPNGVSQCRSPAAGHRQPSGDVIRIQKSLRTRVTMTQRLARGARAAVPHLKDQRTSLLCVYTTDPSRGVSLDKGPAFRGCV